MLIVHFKTQNNEKKRSMWWPFVWDKLSLTPQTCSGDALLFLTTYFFIKLRHLYPYEYRPNLINQCVHSEMRRSRGRLVCGSACARSTGVTGEWEVVTPCVSRRSPDMMSSLSGRGSTRPRPDRQTGGLLLAPLIYWVLLSSHATVGFLPSCLRTHHIF